jgi:nucleoside-diphosphate-sugar epimerase
MNDQTSVLVTGSDGFIGRHLVPFLAAQGYRVIAASRTASTFEGPNISAIRLPDLSLPFDWQPLLQQANAAVHLAGIAHTADDDLYDRVNHHATEALARAAARSGTHLVFVSSIAAQSGSFSDCELTEGDPPRPNNAYGRSKLAAEQSVGTPGASFTILRPVVIYGKGEKGNFATIHKFARLPVPLPFGGLTAQRSVLSIQNFNSAVATVLTNPRARGETFIVSDPTPLTVSSVTLVTAPALVGHHGWYQFRKGGLNCLSRRLARAQYGFGLAAHWWRGRKNCSPSAGNRLERSTVARRNRPAERIENQRR